MSAVNIPRPEHPMPQWERNDWINLNGTWEFEFDFGVSAQERKLYESENKLAGEIVVPFCPESKLSGIAYTDFINAVCYRKVVTLEEKDMTGRLILHFGAVDYEAFVYINGILAGKHKGGYTPFSIDITEYVSEGDNTIFVYAKDDVRSGKQPKGKQANKYYSSGCDYTRTTGIWQTVWLEKFPENYIKDAKYYPDIHDGSLTVVGHTCGNGEVTVSASFAGKNVGMATVKSRGGLFKAYIKLSELHFWEVGEGNLYDLEFIFGEDKVKSYFGLREVYLDGMKFMLNDKSVFQRLVLDQGFYPDGIYTAPTEEDLVKDIKLSLDAGFNGARLHQKVFEPRFLYHCDRMGYIVWGEHGNWGLNYHDGQAVEIFLNEWAEEIERDFNHPSIIGWCPFNETWGYIESRARNTLLSTIYKYTKAVDITRPVIDTSGNYHVVTDIYDVHDYEQNPEIFKTHYDVFANGGALHDQVLVNHPSDYQKYSGEPVFISEYGGIQWNTNGNTGWGYGTAPKTPEEFIERYRGLTNAILDNPKFFGFCYTQLYDIEQEINGLYTYERIPKFDVSVFKKINSKKAAIE